MKNATFFHAGCPASQPVEQELALAIDRQKYQVEVVHLLQESSRLAEAQRAGVRSVPALLLEGRVTCPRFPPQFKRESLRLACAAEGEA